MSNIQVIGSGPTGQILIDGVPLANSIPIRVDNTNYVVILPDGSTLTLQITNAPNGALRCLPGEITFADNTTVAFNWGDYGIGIPSGNIEPGRAITTLAIDSYSATETIRVATLTNGNIAISATKTADYPDDVKLFLYDSSGNLLDEKTIPCGSATHHLYPAGDGVTLAFSDPDGHPAVKMYGLLNNTLSELDSFSDDVLGQVDGSFPGNGDKSLIVKANLQTDVNNVVVTTTWELKEFNPQTETYSISYTPPTHNLWGSVVKQVIYTPNKIFVLANEGYQSANDGPTQTAVVYQINPADMTLLDRHEFADGTQFSAGSGVITENGISVAIAGLSSELNLINYSNTAGWSNDPVNLGVRSDNNFYSLTTIKSDQLAVITDQGTGAVINTTALAVSVSTFIPTIFDSENYPVAGDHTVSLYQSTDDGYKVIVYEIPKEACTSSAPTPTPAPPPASPPSPPLVANNGTTNGTEPTPPPAPSPYAPLPPMNGTNGTEPEPSPPPSTPFVPTPLPTPSPEINNGTTNGTAPRDNGDVGNLLNGGEGAGNSGENGGTVPVDPAGTVAGAVIPIGLISVLIGGGAVAKHKFPNSRIGKAATAATVVAYQAASVTKQAAIYAARRTQIAARRVSLAVAEGASNAWQRIRPVRRTLVEVLPSANTLQNGANGATDAILEEIEQAARLVGDTAPEAIPTLAEIAAETLPPDGTVAAASLIREAGEHIAGSFSTAIETTGNAIGPLSRAASAVVASVVVVETVANIPGAVGSPIEFNSRYAVVRNHFELPDENYLSSGSNSSEFILTGTELVPEAYFKTEEGDEFFDAQDYDDSYQVINNIADGMQKGFVNGLISPASTLLPKQLNFIFDLGVSVLLWGVPVEYALLLYVLKQFAPDVHRDVAICAMLSNPQEGAIVGILRMLTSTLGYMAGKDLIELTSKHAQRITAEHPNIKSSAQLLIKPITVLGKLAWQGAERQQENVETRKEAQRSMEMK